MAKYRNNGIVGVGFVAGADYSASTNQYKFVALSASADTVVTGTGGSLPGPIGILQNSPCAGEEARVFGYGMYSKLQVDASTCAVTPGNFLICASDGQGEKVTSTGSVIFNAQAIGSVASGSAVIEVIMLPPGHNLIAAS